MPSKHERSRSQLSASWLATIRSLRWPLPDFQAGWAARLTGVAGTLLLALAACAGLEPVPSGRSDLGMDPGMMARHMAPLPEVYRDMDNPVPFSEDSVEGGETIYRESCAVCHGEQGWGDGPAADSLDPPPAPLVHTAGMLSDAYLFYRISEGGGFPPFNSAMPAFKGSLSTEQRWDTVNFLRRLAEQEGGMMSRGLNQGREGSMMGGMMMGWMLLLGVLVILALVGAVAAVIMLVTRGSNGGHLSGRPLRGLQRGEETALQILKRRYAAGEIDVDEFRRIKADLEGS